MRQNIADWTHGARRHLTIAVIAGALTGTACAPPPARPPNTGDQRLTAQQTEALRNAIASTGDKCSAVGRTFLQGVQDDRSEFWNVQCPEGAYSVRIPGGGGEARIMTCEAIELLTRVPCFRPFN